METLYEIGLTNALVVAAIAPLAFVMSRLAKRRPAWVHAIWVVVLLKLVTPPVAGIPIGWSRVTVVEMMPEVAAPHKFVESAASIATQVPVLPVVEIGKPPVPITMWQWPSWPMILGSVWLGGSLFWASLASWRIVRFARAMKRADDAPAEIAFWVADLSEQIGLAKSPRVVISPGRISPMVWALTGRACLVVPEALWARLDDSQRSAMLVHELAHLRRRDHWVRILELVAIGLFWWHPVMWLARRELHRAEELCCDMWVVWALPQSKKNYAAALVEAVEFLSESHSNKLPVGASGMGQVEDLSRRIGMILRGDAPRGLGRFGAIAAIGLGLMLLPWSPTFGGPQETPAKPEEVKLDGVKKAEGELPDDLEARIQASLDKYVKFRQVKNLPEIQGLELEQLYDRLKWSSAMLKQKYVPANTVKSDMLKLAQAQEDLDDSTSKLSIAYQEALARYKQAQAVKARLSRLNKAGAVSQAEMDKAKVEAEVARVSLAKVRMREQGDADEREVAVQDAQDAVDTATGKLKVQQARVAQTNTQRKLAVATSARYQRKALNNSFSAQELEKAEADLQIDTAKHQEAVAEQDVAAIEVGQAQRRYEALETKQVAFKKIPLDAVEKKAIVESTQGPPYPQSAIDELEKKLDRVIKEIEAMRKDQRTAKPSTVSGGARGGMGGGGGMGGVDEFGGFRQGSVQFTLLLAVRNPNLSNEDVVRKIYRILFDREPSVEEIADVKFTLETNPNERWPIVLGLLSRLLPVWQNNNSESMVDTLLAIDDLTYTQALERTYRAILNRPPTKAEREEKPVPTDFAQNRRAHLKKIVDDVRAKPLG